MQSSIFVKSHEFDPTLQTVTFQDIKWGSGGYGNVVYKYCLNDLLIQTPKLTTPFGFSRGVPNTNNYGHDYNCQFNLDSNTQKTKAFLESLQNFEKVILDYAYDKRVEWGIFGNQTEAERATLDVMKGKMTPIVKPSRDPRYAPTLQTKFRKRKDKDNDEWVITAECHDEKNKEIVPSEETIPRRSQCIMVLRGRPLWISPEGKFGVSWQIERMKVYPPEERPSYGGEESFVGEVSGKMPVGSCLLDSDDED